eukprot:scaffold7415_cov170-Amphora_coffeaeformis.AAC.4
MHKISRLCSEDAATRIASTRHCPQTKATMSRSAVAAKKGRNDAEDTPRGSTANKEASSSKEIPPAQRRSKEEEDAILEYAIDSFLRGDYNLKLPDSSKPLPPPDLGPGPVVSAALRSLRGRDLPSQTHGAAVFMRFCLPLRRSERWGDASSVGKDPWKEVLRGGLTASTFVRRLRASEFAGLLDWSRIDVTEGAYTSDRDLVGLPSIAYVNAALFFEEESGPSLFQFKLRRVGGGAWMIDTIRRSQKELFLETDGRGSSK